jgi:hypothetical protein
MNIPSSASSDEIRKAWRGLGHAAWLCLIIHLLAGIAMAVILRQGLATNPDFIARLEFVSSNKTLWISAWATWNAAAMAILYFYASFVHAHGLDGTSTKAKAPLKFAVIWTIAAVAADLSAEAIQMGVLPGVAGRALTELAAGSSSPAAQLFLALDRIAVMMTGYMANGLYSVSALALVYTTRAAYPRWTFSAGLLVGVAGIALSIASLIGSVSGMVWSNIFLIPCLIAWQAGVALTAANRSAPRAVAG